MQTPVFILYKQWLNRSGVNAYKLVFIFRVMDHLKTKVKEHELDRAEGEELKKLAIQYGIEKKKLDQIRIEEKLQLGM